MERTKKSQIFYTAIFLAVISLVFSAGCASSGGGVQTSLAKTNAPSSTGKIYSVTLESGEKQQMTETEFRAYQNAQDAKEKQQQNPTTQKGKKEEVTPSTTHKKVDKKGEKSGKKEVETKTSTRTYTEAEYKSALLDARVEDKGQIADLTKTKNEHANRVRELEAENARLRSENEHLRNPATPTATENPEGNPGDNNGWAGAAAIALLFLLFVGSMCAAAWLLITHPWFLLALPVGGIIWWATQSRWMTATGAAGMALVCLAVRRRQRREADQQNTPTDEAAAKGPAAKTEQPVQEVQIQEPDSAGDGITPAAQVDPVLEAVLESSEDNTDAVTGGTSRDGDRAVCIRRAETPKGEKEERPTQTQRPQEKGNKKRRKNRGRQSGSNSLGTGQPDAKNKRI